MSSQMIVRVRRYGKIRPTWGVGITEITSGGTPLVTSLPGEFRTWRSASVIAETLAFRYRQSGYEVALDTMTCRKRATAATQAYGVA